MDGGSVGLDKGRSPNKNEKLRALKPAMQAPTTA